MTFLYSNINIFVINIYHKEYSDIEENNRITDMTHQNSMKQTSSDGASLPRSLNFWLAKCVARRQRR